MVAFNALNALARISPGAAALRRQPGDAALLSGLEPGQRVRGRVHNNLANGEFLVELTARHAAGRHGQAVQMQLPANVRPGDLLELVFVSREPRPTFVITAEDSLYPPGVSSRVSETGHFIDQLLRQPAAPAGLTALSSTASLLTGPPTDSAQLAKSLAGALDRSGLFYESHMAQWIAGSRSLPKLLLEPQARFSSPIDSTTMAMAGVAGMGMGAGTAAAAVVASNPATGVAATTADATADALGTHDPVHPASLGLVRQQLDILETRQFALQGIVWPGQVLAWEAAQEKPQNGGEPGSQSPQEQGSSSVWRTCVRLTLPSLGSVAASLRLDARSGWAVDVHLAAAETGTVTALRTSVAPLADGLKAAGIELSSMRVERDEA